MPLTRTRANQPSRLPARSRTRPDREPPPRRARAPCPRPPRSPSLNPLTPRLYLDGFAGGVWLRYELPAVDVRVRISCVAGEMAVLSAIAFDEIA